jgi:hypothetical protein
VVDFGSWAEGTDFTLPLIPFSGEIHERIAALEVHWRKEQGGLRDGHFKVIGYERARPHTTRPTTANSFCARRYGADAGLDWSWDRRLDRDYDYDYADAEGGDPNDLLSMSATIETQVMKNGGNGALLSHNSVQFSASYDGCSYSRGAEDLNLYVCERASDASEWAKRVCKRSERASERASEVAENLFRFMALAQSSFGSWRSRKEDLVHGACAK